MYEFLRGTLDFSRPEVAVLDVNGIGFRCVINARTFSSLPPLHEDVTLFVSFVVREQAQTLFAFATRHDRDLFERLLLLSGIGPKTALAILNMCTCEQFFHLVSLRDVKGLSKIPGLGKKTAEKLLFELSDSVPKLSSAIHSARGSSFHDAFKALCNLGYKENQAQETLERVLEKEPDLSLPALIGRCLQTAKV